MIDVIEQDEFALNYNSSPHSASVRGKLTTNLCLEVNGDNAVSP